ncbi:MAG: radical SAM family protein [Planctomycetota bacterium]
MRRDLPIFLADRKSDPVVHDWHGDKNTFCPPVYWDLAIGSGPCGFGCRGCYLLGTFRAMRDPLQPLVYENLAFFWDAARQWLVSPHRRSCHTLGLGTDRSDSLLFEGATHHARHLIPMFADRARNPLGCKLFLLTKSKNARFLEGLPTQNIAVSFSLNPQPIADLWEGKWPDTLERIPPPIDERCAASLQVQRMGFEVRWRIDPILTPAGWHAQYRKFFSEAAATGNRPTRITLGTFRETRASLDYWRQRWNLPPMGWRPRVLRRDGTHRHAPIVHRVRTYRAIAAMCAEFFPDSILALCKETKAVWSMSGLASAPCNCLK